MSRTLRTGSDIAMSDRPEKRALDAIYRIQSDALALQHLVTEGLIPLVTSFFTLAGMIYFTAHLDASLALVALSICPILFFLSRYYRRRLRGRAREIKRLESSALAVVQEVLAALRVVKAFGQEGPRGGAPGLPLRRGGAGPSPQPSCRFFTSPGLMSEAATGMRTTQ